MKEEIYEVFFIPPPLHLGLRRRRKMKGRRIRIDLLYDVVSRFRHDKDTS